MFLIPPVFYLLWQVIHRRLLWRWHQQASHLIKEPLIYDNKYYMLHHHRTKSRKTKSVKSESCLEHDNIHFYCNIKCENFLYQKQKHLLPGAVVFPLKKCFYSLKHLRFEQMSCCCYMSPIFFFFYYFFCCLNVCLRFWKLHRFVLDLIVQRDDVFIIKRTLWKAKSSN